MQCSHAAGRTRAGGEVRGRRFTVAAIMLITLICSCKARHNADMAACENNLKRIETALRQYANDNGGVFPPVSSQPGVLMFSADAIPPKDLGDPLSLTCPLIRYAKKPAAGRRASGGAVNPYDDQSYFYLGYAVLDDDDVEAFAEAYRKQISEGGTFGEDLVVEDDGETRVLHRLTTGVKEAWRATGDPNAVSPHEGREAHYQVPGVISSDVPLLIERDVGHVFTDWDGPPRGAHVLYLHDGVQFVQTGTWPMTEKTQRILAELADLSP